MYLDEYKMIKEEMYQDLVVLAKNNLVSEITRKSDVTLALAQMYTQIEQERKESRFGIGGDQPKKDEAGAKGDAEDEDERTKEAADENEGQSIGENKKIMQKWPSIQAELYRTFLNRVKNQFHLIL